MIVQDHDGCIDGTSAPSYIQDASSNRTAAESYFKAYDGGTRPISNVEAEHELADLRRRAAEPPRRQRPHQNLCLPSQDEARIFSLRSESVAMTAHTRRLSWSMDPYPRFWSPRTCGQPGPGLQITFEAKGFVTDSPLYVEKRHFLNATHVERSLHVHRRGPRGTP